MKNNILYMCVGLIILINLSSSFPTQYLVGPLGMNENSQNDSWSAEYQLIVPRSLQVAEVGVIDLLIIPDSLPTEKLKFREEDQKYQISQDKITVYANSSIEIKGQYPIKIEDPRFIEMRLDPNEVFSWQWEIIASEKKNCNNNRCSFFPTE